MKMPGCWNGRQARLRFLCPSKDVEVQVLSRALRTISSVGRASHLHCECQGFKSLIVHKLGIIEWICQDSQDGQGACLKNTLSGFESWSWHRIMPYFIYIAQGTDSSFYTGYTVNVEKRIQEHNVGKRGAKYLRGKTPVKLMYSETFETKSEALKREAEIKTWTREQKSVLIKKFAGVVQR